MNSIQLKNEKVTIALEIYCSQNSSHTQEITPECDALKLEKRSWRVDEKPKRIIVK